MKKNKLKIKKNFLRKDLYLAMKSMITDSNFSWYLQHGITYKYNKDIFFTHNFFTEYGINSSYYEDIVIPFVEKLKIKKLLRAKLNLYTKTNKEIIHGFHTDREDDHMVALFYFNKNNGHTLFRKDKVKPEDNKIVMFDGSLEHTSTSCTDEDYRITLNINYV
jgi:hypothetical protein